MIAARKAGRHAAAAWERAKKDIEIDRTLRAFGEAGVSAVYHACDVSDRAALAQVLDEIRQADGPIAGILHGAGLDALAASTRNSATPCWPRSTSKSAAPPICSP